MNYKIKVPEVVYIEIIISGDNREEVFDIGRSLLHYLEGLFDNGRFIIKEAGFYPYIIKFGCPTEENIKVLSETVETIIKGFLGSNGQD